MKKEQSEKKIEKKNGLLEKAEKIRQKELKTGNSKLKPFIIKFIISLLIILCLVAGSIFGFKKFTAVKYEKTHALVEKQLSLCQELVTAKYRYSDIIVVKKSMGFSKSYSIVKYTGLLRAGLADITDVDFSLSKDGRVVTLSVPKAQLLGNELVSQEVFDEKQSIFVPISTQEIFNEIEDARRETAEDMLADGFLDEARAYAIRIICQFLSVAGFKDVRVK